MKESPAARFIKRFFFAWLAAVILSLCLPCGGQAQQAATQGEQNNQPDQQTSSSSDTRPAAGVIDQSQLTGLPMNGRSYTQLATLQAGISDPSGGGRQGGQGASITISGGRGEWNSFLQDGTDINDSDNQVPRSAAGGQLGADAIAQVQVFSTNYGAQYGRAAGGIMNAITRSGSNEFRGTFFEFFRNSKTDSRNFFDSSQKPPFKRNQFGAAFSGPVIRDGTFFMGAFESLLDRLNETIVLFVPDNAILLNAAPNVKQYVDFYLPGQIPVLDQNGRPTGVAENRTPAKLPTNEHFFVARLDHQWGDKDGMFVRYTFDDATQSSVSTSPVFPRVTESRQQYVTMAHTHFFSPALINTSRLGYTRPVTNFFVDYRQDLTGKPLPPFYVPGSPQIGNINVSGLTVLGPNPEAPWKKVMNSFQGSDDVIKTFGPHTLKFGGVIERFQWNVFDNPNKGASWTFKNVDSLISGGKGGGTAIRVALPESDSYRAFRQTLVGLYFQDDYRVLQNVTLNLGLRYEFTSIIHDKFDHEVFLADEFRDTSPSTGAMMSKNPSLRNIAPRFGLSWAPGGTGRTVLRAGAGIYYDQIIEYSVHGLRITAPYYSVASLPNADVSSTFPNALAAVGNQRGKSQVSIFEYNNPKTPTVYRYHFDMQHELFSGLTINATYLGARGNNLLRNIEANQYPLPIRQADGRLFFPADPTPDPVFGPDNTINPAFGSIQKVLTDAQSFYNSFVISLSPRPWHGLTLGGNYTFSKSVDDTSSGGGGGAGGFGSSGYGLDRTLDRALSSFDIPHRFTMRYSYELPGGSGQSGFLSAFLRGWRIGGVLSARSGQASGVNYGITSDGFLFTSERPDLMLNRGKTLTEGTTAGCNGVKAGTQLGGPDLYWDPCAFGVPQAGYLGTAGRNIIRGPKTVNLDFSLQKDFSIDSRRRIQFRAELFNLPNHTNFRPPQQGANTVFRNSAGLVNPSAGKLRTTSTNARQIQFALRLSF